MPKRRRRSKKTLPEEVAAAIRRHKRVEVWFQDEARFGQKGTLTRVWGLRVTAKRSLAYEWSYFYGSVCPAKGLAHGLLLPYADLEGMRLYLDDFSRSLKRGVYALLVCDQAGWHTSGRLPIPDNVGLLFLPPKSPELNPAELVWREMRQKHLGNRVFPSVDGLDDAICEAWLEVTKTTQRMTSLCGFNWITDNLN